MGRIAYRVRVVPFALHRTGRFSLDGASYQLAQNNSAGHSIHGGVEGFDKRVWAATAVATAAVAKAAVATSAIAAAAVAAAAGVT